MALSAAVLDADVEKAVTCRWRKAPPVDPPSSVDPVIVTVPLEPVVPAVDSGYFTAWQPYVKSLYVNFAGQAWFRRAAADIWFDQEKMPKDRNLN